MKKSNLHFILYILYAIMPPFVCEVNDLSSNESCFRFKVETPPDTIIQVSGDEQNQVNLTLPDGALPPKPWVLNIELLRTPLKKNLASISPRLLIRMNWDRI